MTGFQKSKKLAAVAAILSLTACGGGGGSDDPSPPPPASVTASGIVADGYLRGAKVCLDKNNNMACDSNEPSTMTGVGGAYTLTGVSSADLVNYPVLVEVTTATFDEERGQVLKPYVLSAPAGKSFISPLTTLAHSEMKMTGVSVEVAEQTLKTRLGLVTMSPFDDYKPAASDANAEQLLLANVAKVVATTLANAKDQYSTVPGYTTQAAVNAISQQISQNLASIVQQSNTSATLTEAQVTAISGTVAVVVNEQKLTEVSGVRILTNAEISSSLKKGQYWIDVFYRNNMLFADYEKILLLDTGKMEFKQYELFNNNWRIISGNQEVPDLYLTAQGWKADNNNGFFNSSTGVYSSANGYEKKQVGAIKIDVSGLKIVTYMNNSVAMIFGNNVFPPGSEAYKLILWDMNGTYRLKQDWTFGYSSLAEMITSASTSSSSSINFNNAQLKFGAMKDNGGVIEIFKNGNPSPIMSTYQRITVHGNDMIIVDTSAVSQYGDDANIFFTVYNGQVTGGYFSPKNVAAINNSSYDFNQTALSAIMAAANLPAPLP